MTPGDGRAPPSPGPNAGASPSRRGDSRSNTLAQTIGCATIAGLLALTVVPTGASRMYSWPWSVLYAATLLGPVALLLLCAFDAARPLVLPGRAGQWFALAMAGVLLGSAAASPYRATSFLWSAPYISALAAFLVVVDALHRHGTDPTSTRETAWRLLNGFFSVVAIASLVEWLSGLGHATLRELVAGRNLFPLGHPNYTAGLAIVMLPGFVAASLKKRGWMRISAAVGALLALALLFSSGSRGAIIALAAMIAGAVALSPLRKATKCWIALLAAAAVMLLVGVNPRTRAMFLPTVAEAEPNISNVQRQAMFVAGARMGADRPVLGWGPGTTPLAYPRYRAGLKGGAEDVLQLHCLPLQLWAELGLAGLVVGAGLLLIAVAGARRDPVAFVALGGYLVFSLFDAQLDVPVFGFTVATLAAFLAAPQGKSDARTARVFGLAAAVALAITFGFGRRDPTPELNVRALQAADRGARPEAVALLRESLRQNPDQEIAHFNLGWLLVVDDPPVAAKHFIAAAHLVPDKGGVYFGLGLARLNSGDRAGAARAFALEALNDPVFLLSPWWQNPQMAAVRDASCHALDTMTEEVSRGLPAHSWVVGEQRYFRALAAWLDGALSSESVLAVANTERRRDFFRGHPLPAAVRDVGVRTLRHQRIGYPILMRNLDLAPPLDVWAIQESKARQSLFAFLWPDKGWLPSPLLIGLLERGDSPNN